MPYFHCYSFSRFSELGRKTSSAEKHPKKPVACPHCATATLAEEKLKKWDISREARTGPESFFFIICHVFQGQEEGSTFLQSHLSSLT